MSLPKTKLKEKKSVAKVNKCGIIIAIKKDKTITRIR